MNRKEILRLRSFNQKLSGDRFAGPEEVVAHFGAMQAQDYNMSLWAVGMRTEAADRTAVEDLIHAGRIIRTHVLRPTWHLVHRDDIRWMMALSAPHVRKAMRFIDKKEGLTDVLFKKAWRIIERKLGKGSCLSKEGIMSCLAEGGLVVSNLLATQIIIHAELNMLLCNGDRKGTYAHFDGRVPAGGKLTRDEALARLADLYFTSRSPATWKDFAWWGGLSAADAKIGMAGLGKHFETVTWKETTFFFSDKRGGMPSASVDALLPCFDEYTVGYAEGRDIIFPSGVDKEAIGNGIFHPVILSADEIGGIWRRTNKPPFVELKTFPRHRSFPDEAF